MPDLTLQKSLMILFGFLAGNVYSHETSRKTIRSPGDDFKLAERLVPAIIEPRATFYGGWTLHMSPCPSGLEDFNGLCCPAGTFLHTVYYGAMPTGSACCPYENSNCGDAVASMPICADTSWKMWVNEGQHPFCCLDGDIGFWTKGGIWGAGSSCTAGDVPVPSDVLASSIIPSTAAAATKTSGGSSATSTSGSGGGSNINNNDNSIDINSDSSSSSNSVSSSNSMSNSSTTNTSGLSTGAIAGIVGGGVGVLAAITLAIFLIRKRKNTSIPSYQPNVPEVKPADPSYYGGGTPVYAQGNGSIYGYGVGDTPTYQEAQTKPPQTYFPPPTEADGTAVAKTDYRGELAS